MIYNIQTGIPIFVIIISTFLFFIKKRLKNTDNKEQGKSKNNIQELQRKADEAKKVRDLEKYNEYVRQMTEGHDIIGDIFKQLLAIPITLLVILPMFIFVFPYMYETEIDNERINASEGDIVVYNGYRYLVSNKYNNTLELSMVAFELPISLPLINYTMGWFSYYILLTITYRHFILKKIYKKFKS